MAKKAKGGEKRPRPAAPTRRRPPLVDRVTRLVLVLFLVSLAVPHLAT